jgi:hypothetical protein
MTRVAWFRDRAGQGNHGRTGPPRSGGRYGLLLLVLIATYVFSAFNAPKVTTADLQLVFFAAALLLAMRTSPLPGRWPQVIGGVAVAGSAAALGASLTGTRTGAGLADLWKALMLLLTAVLIVRRVLARPVVTLPGRRPPPRAIRGGTGATRRREAARKQQTGPTRRKSSGLN